MVVMYQVLGRQVGSHWVWSCRSFPSFFDILAFGGRTDNFSIKQLAMATLGGMVGITMLSSGGSKAKAGQGPPINAQSPDEEKFIKYVDPLSRNWVSDFIFLAADAFHREFMANAEAEEKKSHGIK
jgi:hypothetical protein